MQQTLFLSLFIREETQIQTSILKLHQLMKGEIKFQTQNRDGRDALINHYTLLAILRTTYHFQEISESPGKKAAITECSEPETSPSE